MSASLLPELHVVHCIDTEGPLVEGLPATFDRLRAIFGLDLPATAENLRLLQERRIPLAGREAEVARVVAPGLLRYNESWDDIDRMLDDALSPDFRCTMRDDQGEGWVYSWHCMDHAGYSANPRQKDVGYGRIFRHYRDRLAGGPTRDELNWHYHPLSFSRNPLQCATNYVNSYDVLNQVLCRRVIEEKWFPLANRPGFHTERPDIHLFLEQWIPFDYANQSWEAGDDGQPDLVRGRFGDWRRASRSWRGYQPAHDDYQAPGTCRRWIFRCLNVGTRFRELGAGHVEQAFREARETGSAILAFADHDYRDIRPDVQRVRELLAAARPDFRDVRLRFSGAAEAARAHLGRQGAVHPEPLALRVWLEGPCLQVEVARGKIFGPQPYLALQTKAGAFHHDNFDVQAPGRRYTYSFDDQTLPLSDLRTIGVASAGRCGHAAVQTLLLP